ncbi:MAG: hypothetical protein DRP65_00455 [Planctomycetota bacterium]|nr:MAG: hypothetical protein DRP65_00455 [Planctomycetota bacterium]
MEYDTKELRYVHAFVADTKDAIDIDGHRINFVVSSDIVDRDNEKVVPDAVFEAIHRKDEFAKNPICLACHLHRLGSGEPPGIGHWDIETAKQKKHHVEMVLQFDVEYELGNKYWTVYKNKTMRAVSIGFRILDGHEEVKDGKRIYIITKIELYEISCVAVGANRQAVSTIKSILGFQPDSGSRDKAEIPGTLKDYIDSHFSELKEFVDLQFMQIKDLLVTDPDGLAESMLGSDSEPAIAGDDGVSAERLESIQKLANEISKG